MHSSEELERACADAWQPVVRDKIGDWRLRAATDPRGDDPMRRTRFTGRANSALAVGEPGMPTEHALLAVREFAQRNGIEPMVQAIAGSEVETHLTNNGWRFEGAHGAGFEVSVMTAPLPMADAPAAQRAEIGPEPSARWWKLAFGTAEPSPAQRHVVTSGHVGYGAAVVDGVLAGAVRATLVRDLLHIGGLAVREDHRRTGLAAELMSAAGAWARTRGARDCVLQVAAENSGALALYSELGFTEIHRYRYWTPR